MRSRRVGHVLHGGSAEMKHLDPSLKVWQGKVRKILVEAGVRAKYVTTMASWIAKDRALSERRDRVTANTRRTPSKGPAVMAYRESMNVSRWTQLRGWGPSVMGRKGESGRGLGSVLVVGFWVGVGFGVGVWGRRSRRTPIKGPAVMA